MNPSDDPTNSVPADWLGSADPNELELQELFLEGIEQEPEMRERIALRLQDPFQRDRLRSLFASHDALEPEKPDEFALNSADSDDPLIGRSIGQFTIERLIGKGSHGRVYAARQSQPTRIVALKIMGNTLSSAKARRRFEYESEILARLRHPGVSHVYGAGVEMIGGLPLPWFAMELIEGAQNIVTYVSTANLPIRDRVRFAVNLCEVIQFGHQHGVLHRDLKPSNILVGADHRLKVIDFGVASSISSNLDPIAESTQSGELIGTLSYMSPEQCDLDPNAVDARSDVYALGAILYEMLTSTPAVDVRSKSLVDALNVVAQGTTILPSTLNHQLRGDLDAIIMKALERDPARRYITVMAMAQDLCAYMAGEPVLARQQTFVYRSERFVTRHWLSVSVIAAVFAILASSAIVSMRALSSEQRAHAAEEQRSAELLKALQQSEEEMQVRQAAVDFLSRNVVGAIPARAGKPDATVRESLLLAVGKIGEVANGNLRAEINLRQTAGAALQGMNELRAAADQYGALVELVDANPDKQLLAPNIFVNILGSYGLVLSSIGDDRAAAIQARAWEDGNRLLGARNQEAIFAGAKFLSSAVKRDGFEPYRASYEKLYALAIDAIGIDAATTQVLRQGLARNLAQLGRIDRMQSLELAELELASAARTTKPLVTENARSLMLEVLVAQCDPTAIPLAREMTKDAERIYGATAAPTLRRRALLAQALQDDGDWMEAVGIARHQAEASEMAATMSGMDRADNWMYVAIAAAESGDQNVAQDALARAATHLPSELSNRTRIFETNRIRVQAVLDGPLAASKHFETLRIACDAITGTRPQSLSTRREAHAILARLAAQSGNLNSAQILAREYSEELQSLGIKSNALEREMQTLQARR